MLRNVFFKQICSQESHAAVNIKTNASRTDDRFWIVAVERGHTADRKPIAGMQIWHTHTTTDDAGQGGHISNLFDGRQEAAVARRRALLFEFIKDQIF